MDTHHEQERSGKGRVSAQDKDLKQEAIAEGTTPEHIQQHGTQYPHTGQNTSDQAGATPGQLRPDHLVDGYALTEGDDYEQPRRDEAEGYDPTHSGVRHAPNKPGAPTSAPGRDEGTGWAEQAQNGADTDTSIRRNPAN